MLLARIVPPGCPLSVPGGAVCLVPWVCFCICDDNITNAMVNSIFYNSGLDVTHNRVSFINAHYVSLEDVAKYKLCCKICPSWQARYGRAAAGGSW